MKSRLRLTESECEVIRVCLEAVASGDVIEHDDAFPSVMGVEVDCFLQVQQAWPAFRAMANAPISKADWKVVSDALQTLLGHPHKLEADEAWAQRLPVRKEEVSQVSAKVRAALEWSVL